MRQFVNTQSHTGASARKLRNARVTEFPAAVIGKLKLTMVGDFQRQASPMPGRAVLQMRNLGAEAQGISPSWRVEIPSDEYQGF